MNESKRSKVVQGILEKLTNELVITSCGNVSKEAYWCNDRTGNFYNMGAMGTTLGIGIGVALNTTRTVIVLLGDGEILMSLGTLVLLNKLKLNNIKVYILDNNCYETTGGQRTCSDAVSFEQLCPNNVKVIKIPREEDTHLKRIPLTHKEIARRFRNELLC